MSPALITPVHLEVSPRATGADRRLAGQVLELFHQVGEDSFPASASFALVRPDGAVLRAWTGWSCLVGERVEAGPGTLYDLASLTKVIASVTLSLALVEQGSWSLSDPVAKWLGGFPSSEITLWHLLTHTSGLVPHRPFYRLGHGVGVIRPALYSEVELAKPSDDVCYSDLNYILLGWAISSCAGLRLDRLWRERVAAPLGMGSTRYRPPQQLRRVTAATELDGDQRAQPGLVWGEVHDGNAWALGGVSGHAGLFAPVDDLARFVAALLADHHPVLGAGSVAELSRYQAGRLPDVRGLGWRLEPQGWGPWPEGTYWHTGFTGTSLLVAPRAGVAVVLASNAVHPKRRLEDQADFRVRVHQAIALGLA